MATQFWPCPGCSRHVRRGDAICPFCGASASRDIGSARVLAGRLSRAALFAAGAVGATVATTDCNSAPPIPSTPTVTAPYGAAPPPIETTETEDSSTSDAESAMDGPNSVLATTPPYGQGPPPIETEDSGTSDAPSSSIEDATITDAADASTDMTPTDSSSTADVPLVIVFYGAAVRPDE